MKRLYLFICALVMCGALLSGCGLFEPVLSASGGPVDEVYLELTVGSDVDSAALALNAGEICDVLESRLKATGCGDIMTEFFDDIRTFEVRFTCLPMDEEALVAEIKSLCAPGVLIFCEKEDGSGVLLNNDDVASAEAVVRDEQPDASIQIEFTADGGRKFSEATTRLQGEVIYIILDNEVLSSPTVQSPITDGIALITGDLSLEEAVRTAARIASPPLPFPLSAGEGCNRNGQPLVFETISENA